jgi:hypothetical protein
MALRLDTLFGSNAPTRAARIQAKSASKSAAKSKKNKKQNLADNKKTQNKSINELEAGEAEGLRYREQAGEALTAAEQQALARFDAAEARATGTLTQGRDAALNEFTTGEGSALNALRGGTDTARADLQGGYDTASGELRPWAQTGIDANEEQAKLQGLRGPEAQAEARSRFNTDPGYAFRLEQGLSAIDRLANAGGGRYAGSTMKDFNDYAQGQASQEYGNYFNRFDNIANRGLQASTSLAQLASQLGVNLAELEAQYGANAADIITKMAQQRGLIQADSASRIATNQANFGQLGGTLTGNMGVQRSNLLTGTGDFSYGAGKDISNTMLGQQAQRVGIRDTGTSNVTNALSSKANAQAAGIVGQANADQQAFGNVLSLVGTGVGLATAPLSGGLGGGGTLLGQGLKLFS